MQLVRSCIVIHIEMMNSTNVEDNEWFDELEDSLEEYSDDKSEKVRTQMETLDRKKVNRDPQAKQRPKGLVESMMKCVITDSTLEHAVRNYQVALTPRTRRRYQSPLLSGRRVLSQIPRAAVSNSPLHSPRRIRGGLERVRVYASPARPIERQEILRSKLVPSKEQNLKVRENVSQRNICDESHESARQSQQRQVLLTPKVLSNKEQNLKVKENAPQRNISDDEFLSNHPASPLVTKRISNGRYIHPSDKEVIVMKGLLWVQQDKLFSRWKERFIVLTSHYLQFFKKTSSRISEMGDFLMKVKLGELSSVSLEDRRGYLTLVVSCLKEGRLVFRKTEGIREWHDSLEMFLTRSKEDTKDGKMESTEQFWDRSVKEDEVRIRDKIGNLYSYLTPPRSSALPNKSPTPVYSPNYFLPSSPHPGRSTGDDSGLESMKTSTSDSGTSSLNAQALARLSANENHSDKKKCAIEDVNIYKKFEKVKSDPEKSKKEKHERGVSMAEYSKFKAKLPFITP